MNEDELAELAAKVGKSLRWASLLLGAMLVVLLIDLQLKRSLARTAIEASRQHNAIVHMADGIMADLTRGGRGRGQPVVAKGASPGRSAGSSGVDGDAPVAAPADPADTEAPGIPAAAPAGPRKRAPRNGGRTQRPGAGG